MNSFILPVGLTNKEQAKLDRLDQPLAKIFDDAGYAVRECRAVIKDDTRRLEFSDLSKNQLVLRISSQRFLSTPEDELLPSIFSKFR